MGIASLTLGITSLIAWLDPFLGLPISIVGIILGVLSLWRSLHQRQRAVPGLVTSIIRLLLTIILLVLGVIAFITFPEYFTY